MIDNVINIIEIRVGYIGVKQKGRISVDTKKFFEKPEDHSLIKAEIVKTYFVAWAKVMVNTLKKQRNKPDRILYLDLCAGMGRYDDGTPSTPILVIQEVLASRDLCEWVKIILNDNDKECADSLKEVLNGMPGLDRLRYKPVASQTETGDDVVALLQKRRMAPTFSFIDPFGYKVLSKNLFHSVIKDWGCDCVFLFNYRRINMDIAKKKWSKHRDSIFGRDRGNELVNNIQKAASKQEREKLVLSALEDALSEAGAKYMLTYRVKNRKSDRPSHYLVFITKDFLGYDIMKGIMYKRSTGGESAQRELGFDPRDRQLMFDLFPTEFITGELAESILAAFQGQELKMYDVYKAHSVGTLFIPSHYKDALLKLEEQGAITADPPAEKRPKKHGKPTFAEKVVVTFPSPKIDVE